MAIIAANSSFFVAEIYEDVRDLGLPATRNRQELVVQGQDVVTAELECLITHAQSDQFAVPMPKAVRIIDLIFHFGQIVRCRLADPGL